MTGRSRSWDWSKLRYALAERVASSTFEMATNNAFAKVSHVIDTDETSRDIIAYAFEHMYPSCTILQMLVDRYCEGFDPEQEDCRADEIDELPKQFVRRVMIRLREDVSANQSFSLGRCYWKHRDDGEEKACKKLHMEYDSSHNFSRFR